MCRVHLDLFANGVPQPALHEAVHISLLPTSMLTRTLIPPSACAFATRSGTSPLNDRASIVFSGDPVTTVPPVHTGAHSVAGVYSLKAGVDYYLRVAVETTRSSEVPIGESAVARALTSATALNHHSLTGATSIPVTLGEFYHCLPGSACTCDF
jgi:hypothetical protein